VRRTIFGSSSGSLHDGERALSGCISLVVGGTETGFGIDPLSWWRVARLLKTARFDLIHMHEPLMPLVPWFVLQQSAAPTIATFHTHREEGHRWYGRFHWLLAPLMRRVRTRLAVSDAARRTVAKAFPGDYEIVPNGIDVERFRCPAPRPSGMPAHRRFILCVGRLEPRKGVDRLIRAMPLVQRAAPDVRLAVVGDGPDRAALEATARNTGTDVLFTGRVDDALLPAYYHAAEIVCAPALGGESFGIVLLEAMAAARPIVATRIDGYLEILANAGSARLADVDDAPALAAAIVPLLADPEACRTLGANGAAFVGAYDWSTIARRLESIYARTVADR
jgi:phosphatidylinositol alpha-mannosyltransferase